MKKAIVPSDKQIKLLFDVGLHLGHKKNRLHPNARRFVYRVESGVSIIDLTFTATQLQTAKDFLTSVAKEGKTLLVIATKRVAASFAQDLCKKHNVAYITTKWLPGLLTNFETIIENVKKLKKLHEQKTQGEWEKLVKHERTELSKKMTRLEKFYGGLLTLEKRPDVVFVLDAKREKNAVVEATSMNIPVVAVTDTNADPGEVDFPIVANDDSPTAVEYLLNEVITSYTKNRSLKSKEESS